MKSYLVEGWRKGECVGFRRVARATTAVRTADHFRLDLDADVVYVKRDSKPVGQWQTTGGWVALNDADLINAIDASDA